MKLLVTGIVLALLIVAQQTVSISGDGRLAAGLHNGLHGCWFAVVTWLLLLILAYFFPTMHSKRLLVSGAGLALLVATGTEIVQQFTGRDAQILDVGLDLLGAGAALVLWAVRTRMLERWRGVSLAATALVLSMWPFIAALSVNLYRDTIAPDLLRPGSPAYSLLFESASSNARVVAPTGWKGWEGRKVLRLDLAPGKYPGGRVKETVADWRPYKTLVVEVFLEGDTAIPLNVSVRFWRFRAEQARRSFNLEPGGQVLRIPLDGLFDRDTRQVSDLVIYSGRRSAGRTLYLGAVRLERD